MHSPFSSDGIQDVVVKFSLTLLVRKYQGLIFDRLRYV